MADGVMHCGFDHDFSNFVANCEKDRQAIGAMGAVLAGSQRPFVITSGTGMGNLVPGDVASEDSFDPNHPNPRRASELAGAVLLEQGVNVTVVRLPQVHDPVKQGLITYFVQMAREKGRSAYIGDGQNRMPAVHVLDAARLYRLVLEKGEAGKRYNAVAEEGVTVRAIAEELGRGLKVPTVSLSSEEAPGQFGWMSMFAAWDMPASSALTRERLDWHPQGLGLIADLERMDYFPG